MIVTVVWFNHHEMFHNVRFADYAVIIHNTLLMLNIILIPFAASLLGKSFTLGRPDSTIACLIYGLWIAIGGLPFNLLWGHIAKNKGLLAEDADAELVEGLRRHYWKGPVLYLAASLLSIASVWLSVGAYVVLIAIYFIPGSKLKRRRRRA